MLNALNLLNFKLFSITYSKEVTVNEREMGSNKKQSFTPRLEPRKLELIIFR